MKKSFIISISCILLSIVILQFIERKKTKIKDSRIALSWSKIRKDKLLALDIILYYKGKEAKYSIQKNNGIWKLTDPINISTHPEKILILINSFLSIYPLKQIQNTTEEEYDSYGLNQPLLKVLGTFSDDKVYGFIVGKTTAINTQHYIADINNKNSIYIIDKEYLIPFLQGISTIIENQLVSQSIDLIIGIEFRNFNHENISLTNINESWVQQKPINNTHVDWTTRKFLLTAKNILFDTKNINFEISEKILAELGINLLTSPKLCLYFLDKSNSEFYIGTKNNHSTYPVYIPSKKILVFSDASNVEIVFNTQSKDFVILK